MASTARTTVRRRLGVLIVGAVVLTALTVASAEASAPAPMGDQAVGLARLGAGPGSGGGLGADLRARTGASTSPRTPVPGFLLDRGRFIRFDAPNAGIETGPNSINNRGQIVGYSVDDDAEATYHGFLRDARGRFTPIDLPGAKATVASRINDRGQIVGRYYQTTPLRGPDARFRGFLLNHGRIVRIDVPGAAQTQAVGINNRGQVVGEYQTPDGTYHGFLWHKGRFTTIDLPGAAATSLVDINDRGQIAGFALDDPATLAGARGFLLAQGVNGPFTPIDVPGAPRNLVYGLNDRNQLVGAYENTNATPSTQPTGTPPMGRTA